MDSAVAAVQAYLRVNGFLTVTEYPILHRRRDGELQEVTDVDVLACRFPEAGRVLPRPGPAGQKTDPDPELELQWGQLELLLGEVKEGEAAFNPAMFRRDVLFQAVRRFGCYSRNELRHVVDDLSEHGVAHFGPNGRVRLVAFASRPSPREARTPHLFVPLSHVFDFLDDYLTRHRAIMPGIRFRDPVMDVLALRAKSHGDP